MSCFAGLKVILDFVPNHSSDEHEWFNKSVNKEEGYENYYVWVDPKANNATPSNWVNRYIYKKTNKSTYHIFDYR